MKTQEIAALIAQLFSDPQTTLTLEDMSTILERDHNLDVSTETIQAVLYSPKPTAEELDNGPADYLADTGNRWQDATEQERTEYLATPPTTYAERIAQLETEGCSTSDAQAIADAEAPEYDPDQDEPEEEEQDALFDESNRATYCPEDDKLRLYVGRVPRPEYLALKAEGWTSTPKQDCDFVAIWTPARRRTAERYAGIIEDEDAGPAERAADRAERFTGYREKRRSEAHGHADTYDAPRTHGYQSQARAERAAARHDKHGTRAVDSWSKAEYWQQRTAGVISNALHRASPSVRLGRIKELELAIARYAGYPAHYSEILEHLKLRLAYENQMIEAQGGRAACVEMEVGGWLGSHQISKITRSPVTKLVVSVELKYMSDSNQYGRPWSDGKGSRLVSMLYNIERLPAGAYRPPTEEERAEYADKVTAAKKEKATAAKAKAAAGENCPLINPTDADADKLQSIWNAANPPSRWDSDKEPKQVQRMTQAQYSANSGGSYARCETVVICEDGTEHRTRYGYNITRQSVFKVRKYSGRVIIITDKPQKPLPWEAIKAARAKCPTLDGMKAKLPALRAAMKSQHGRSPEEGQLVSDGAYVGLVNHDTYSPGWTEAGYAALKEYDEANQTEERRFVLVND